jgi:hypothetical protein
MQGKRVSAHDAQNGPPWLVRGHATTPSSAESRHLGRPAFATPRAILAFLFLVALPVSAQVAPDTAGTRADSSVARLSTVHVTSGTFGLLAPARGAAHSLDRDEIVSRPQLGEDLFRSIARLPGLSSGEYGAGFHVRGGEVDQLHVSLDGLELFEPFHMKDFDNALSILDVQSVDGIDLVTSGFTSEYGGRLGSVLAIRSQAPRTDRTRTTVGASVTNLRLQSQGGFADGRGGWLVAARRGYLDLALKLAGRADSISPKYGDAFATVTWAYNDRHQVAGHVLWSDDHLHYRVNDGGISSAYGSAYGWVTWDAAFSPRLSARTVGSVGALRWDRSGDARIISAFHSTVDDRRRFSLGGVRQDWLWAPSSGFALKWGGEWRPMTASYDYSALRAYRVFQGDSIANVRLPVSIARPTEGTQWGVYLAPRARPVSWLVAELGVRYDRTSWSGDASVSPRANALVTLGPRTSLRLGMGRYAQPQQLFGLQVQDGISTFGAEDVAEHRVAGLEHRFGLLAVAKVEAYERRVTRERPRYINLHADIQVFPELELDRVLLPATTAKATGVEYSLHGLGTHGFDWAASYTHSRVTDRVGAVDAARTWDQAHTFYLDASYHPPSASWRVALAWQVHSGWPAAPVWFEVDTTRNAKGVKSTVVLTRYGPVTALGAQRMPWYHRIDARYTRDVVTSRGRMSFFVDLFNALDTPNPSAYDYHPSVTAGKLIVQRTTVTQLRRLPSAGVSWEF